jgi:hypothetical protein
VYTDEKLSDAKLDLDLGMKELCNEMKVCAVKKPRKAKKSQLLLT